MDAVFVQLQSMMGSNMCDHEFWVWVDERSDSFGSSWIALAENGFLLESRSYTELELPGLELL